MGAAPTPPINAILPAANLPPKEIAPPLIQARAPPRDDNTVPPAAVLIPVYAP
ncbi:hypothetical protein [Helicobacter pylori]|uniref:hypothetical protein n=1 Tax=Helicobacter pylori TaxID=210 RepID=UPI0039DF2F07